MNNVEQKSKQNIKKQNNKINLFLNYCIHCCSLTKKNKKKNKKKFFAKYSIICQFLIFIFPISLFIEIFLMFLHTNIFDIIVKFDYFKTINQEYLKYLVTDIENLNFELNSYEIKEQYEDLNNIIFFKIYFEELISLGLLDEDKVKIFPNISTLSDTFYNFVDEIIKNDRANSLYSFSSNLSKKYIDERSDSFSELLKIYYHFFPLISFHCISVEIFTNQSFLISYQFDDDNNIIDNNILYFSFPRLINDYQNEIIFSPGNNLISPKISKTIVEHTDLINNSFYFENWFIKQDYDFRKTSSEINDLKFNLFNLNYNYEGILNKSNIISLQSLINRKGKKFIINIIFYISQKKFIKECSDYSAFILNDIDNLLINKKYSDNKTFVISQNNITEMSLSLLPNYYFHFGLKDKNYNFYSNGISFDNFDINNLPEPTKHYSSIEGFNYDIRYFSPFYLYTKLFQQWKFFKQYSDIFSIKLFILNDTEKINDICSKFNFNLYKNYLTSNNINCWNKKNLLYYSSYFKKNNNYTADSVSLPNCICLPLYCIKNNKKTFDPNNIQFVEEIILPEKCQNNLMFYDNKIIDKKDEEQTEKNIIGISYLSEFLKEPYEEQYIKFTIKNIKIYNELNCIIICIFDNKSISKILSFFIEKVNIMRNIFAFFEINGIFIIIILAIIFIIINTNKTTHVIIEYKKKSKQYIIQLENKTLNSSENHSLLKKNEIFKDFNSPLLDNENMENALIDKSNDSLNISENELIEDLFIIFSKYYNYSNKNMLKNYDEQKHESKKIIKINVIKDSDELFNIFCLMSLYIPKFILNINLDFDVFIQTKLINNLIKYASKEYINFKMDEFIPTKSIIYELLSSEFINKDYGLTTNLNFNYITNINLDSKNNNYIRKGIYKIIETIKNNDKNIDEKLIIENKDDENTDIRAVYKRNNEIIKKIEEKFEQDDYLKLHKLKVLFNSFLINTNCNYLKKILLPKESI